MHTIYICVKLLSNMEINITSNIASTYIGNIVYNGSRSIINTEIQIIPLNNILVKVSFKLNKKEYSFRAMLSEQEEGTLMLIQDRTTKDYMLTGVSGFLPNKPNVHGGLINKLNSFYFHISLSHYDSNAEEIYFLGKEEQEYERLKEVRSKSILASA